MCWGAGQAGQLGNGSRADNTTPSAVSSLTDVKILAAGANFTCAITSDGTSYCWGDNTYGQLADGTVMETGVAANVVGY